MPALTLDAVVIVSSNLPLHDFTFGRTEHNQPKLNYASGQSIEFKSVLEVPPNH
jgi:hypothetical protein